MKLNKFDIKQAKYHISDISDDVDFTKQHTREWVLINVDGLMPTTSPMATVYINVYNNVWQLNNNRSIETPFSHCRSLWDYPTTTL